MDAWTWLVAYLVGFVLLQLFLYRYFQRGESTSNGGNPRKSGYERLEHGATADSVRNRADSETDGVYCRHCGTQNERDTMYSYCRNCAEPLR